MNEEETNRLLGSSAKNEPAAIVGTSGKRRKITLSEQAQRRVILSDMMISGADNVVIDETMQQTFGMTALATKRLAKEIFVEWGDNDADEQKYARLKQKKRILKNIDKAAKASQFAAVASLESVFMKVAGNEQLPEGMRPDHQIVVTEAFISVIGAMDPQRLQAIVQSERAMLSQGTIETKGQEVENESKST